MMSEITYRIQCLRDGAAFGLEGIGFGLTLAVVQDAGKAGTYSTDGEFSWGGAASTTFWVDPVNQVTAVMMTQYMPSDKYPLREDLKSINLFRIKQRIEVAEGQGFEPWKGLTLCWFSRPVHSTALPSLHAYS